MSLVIRMSKIGRKGEAKFRVVVKEKRSNRDGAPREVIGYVIKGVEKYIKNIDSKRLDYWKSKGAKVSSALEKILE